MKKCTEIEGMSITDKGDMHKKNKRINRTKDMLINRMHKIQGSHTNIRTRKILQRWKEYIGELFHDEKELLVIQRNIEGSEILKSEVVSALAKLNRNSRS